MKACGIIGSPCKNGNVDILVSQVLKGATSKGAETCKIYLNSLKIKPCQSCGVDPAPKHCLFNDDMEQVYDILETSDAIILGSPVYFDTVNAQVKLMIDRCNCLLPYVKKADGIFDFERRIKKRKNGVFIAVAGTDQDFNAILATVRGFFNWANVELVKTFFYAHDDNEIGGVKKDHTKMKEAFNIGANLLADSGIS
jgi:multimeric flavodoxin WrbA